MAEQARKDEEYRILVDRKPHVWAQPFITGAQIKQLASVDNEKFEAWLDVPGPEDQPVGDAESIDLRSPGVERFFTGKKTTTEG